MNLFQAIFRRTKPGRSSLHNDEAARRNIAADENLSKASDVWSDRARELNEEPKASSWSESEIVLREYINPAVSGRGDRNWLEAVARDYFSKPVARALSLGCGGGGLERHGSVLNIAEEFDGLDLSSGAITLAQEEAKKHGLSHRINYAVADLNRLELEVDAYDAVFASQSVHHIEALEHYMEQVHRTLKSGGLFIINEFVGSNQFQWPDSQLSLAQRMNDSIPEHYRQLIREPGIKHQIVRATVEQMNAFDPTEAIRSEDIIPQLSKHFEILDKRDFGGTLLHLVLDNIVGNLEADEPGRQILRDLIAAEKALIENGEIRSDFTLIIARKN